METRLSDRASTFLHLAALTPQPNPRRQRKNAFTYTARQVSEPAPETFTRGLPMSNCPSTAPPVMLKDFINSCQRMSATLPPDNWDDTTPPPAIQRCEGGILELSPMPVRSPSTRRVTSAPAAAPSQEGNKNEKPKRERYYASNMENSHQSPSATSESLAVGPPTPKPESAPSFPRGAMQDSPYPSLSPLRTVPSPTEDAPLPARPIPRLAPSTSRQHLLGPSSPTSMHSNRVHHPSPLRNVSMLGERNSEIELLPRGLPRVVYDLPRTREGRRGGWWRWGCCGRRK